jgi:2-succinyl-6-hydroxy-2,4-cyclohexadiene-1-carboxylate synthase
MPHYEVHQGHGPYLLLVHGLMSSRAQWLPNLSALSEVCRPVVLELYGHARSPAPGSRAPYHPRHYVEVFEEIRAALGVERWMVLGQSLGAALTLRYALDHPERVIAHLLTNSNSAFADSSWAEQIRPAMELFLRSVESDGAAALERMPIHPVKSRHFAPEVKAALVEDAKSHDPLGVALSGLETAANSALGDRLPDNRVSTLLVCGAREKRFEPLRRRAERTMPQLEIAELTGGHAINLEAAQAFNRKAIEFIARHGGSL